MHRITWLAVLASQALFLWMFLAADPLEQLAHTGALGDGTDTREAALQFAAEWRHGMSGNSVLYLPGFFATAVAVWLHATLRGSGRASLDAAGTVLIALAAAALLAPIGAHALVGSFAHRHESPVVQLPPPSARAAALAVYTLAAWTTFILGSRAALAHRTWRPLWLPAVLGVGLALVRPWTADDFTAFWVRQLASGSPAAWFSFVLMLTLGTILGNHARTYGTRSSPARRTLARRT